MRSVVRTHAPREQRREQVRHALAAAVERLLAGGESYSELSVERLCEEAGTSRATFYQYFEGKGDLLVQLGEAVLHDLGDTTEFWWHLPPGSTRNDLRAAFGRTFALYREHRGVMRSLSEVAAHDGEMRARLDLVVRWAVEETTSHIRAGVEGGTVRVDADPEQVSEWLCWMFERGLYEIAALDNEQQLDGLLDACTGLVWNAIYRAAR